MTINEKDSELKKKINECYLKALDRPADPDGLQSYFNHIKSGNLTIDQLYLRLKKTRAKQNKIQFLKKISSPFRILPDFLIIGEYKCGTTSLFRYMLEHPSILAPTMKELNFFNRHYKKGILWYRTQFPTYFYKLYCQSKNKTKVITGEATTHYLFANNKIVYRIKKLLPLNKLIVILRNPVDRAYSHYNMFVSEGREPLSFEEAIAYEKQKPDQTTKKEKLPENFQLRNNYTYLSRSTYVDNIKRWMNIFPKEQFLIL